MTEIASPAQAFAAFNLGYFDNGDIVRFVIGYLGARPRAREHNLLNEIARINQRKPDDVFRASALLAEHVKVVGKHDISEQFAKALLKRRLEEYLHGQCAPWAVCRMISPIEGAFDFPDWLGNLYNVCDWTDERTPREANPHLRHEAEKLLRSL